MMPNFNWSRRRMVSGRRGSVVTLDGFTPDRIRWNRTCTRCAVSPGLRQWDLVALVINSIIGAGIFGLPSRVFALAGTYRS